MAAKRRFGRIRKLPSGRWQARYKGPDGIDRPALRTFPTKRDAEVWLMKTEADIVDDEWTDPDLGRTIFGDYARSWIDERPGLRPKTIQLYQYWGPSRSRQSGNRTCDAGASSSWMPGQAPLLSPRLTACSGRL
jgi:hypothetical protein